MAGHLQGMSNDVDWRDLPNDLIKKIGDIFLSIDDLAYYTSFRAVQKGVTGGFIIVLGQRVQPYKTPVLNPLAGCIVCLKAQIPAEELSSVVVMTSPLIVFVSDLQNCSLRWADQSTEEGRSALGFGEAEYRVASCFGVLHNITYYAGDIFTTDKYGSIISSMTYDANEGTQLLRSARTLRMSAIISGPTPLGQYPAYLCYLVESEGELLYVLSGRVYNGEPVVYQVDTKMHVLESVRSIGSRSIFVGRNRCISVDTSKVHDTSPTYR
ncbi:hypothetical protein QYE76_053181 [Lolium multiflorum]|uniref:KIB1-4 beta-propeller domain-containing protein n=1 Tax=Lolium multiflorum TaxID=4521 RepID=A0AAD8SVG6_LOLMU|nr:hypothetical protein QYE76_053181 [Lolium multiflorum]